MIKHLFKLMWNRKRTTTLLLIEIFLSFLVLFGIFSLSIDKYSYMTEPTGFEYKNLMNVSVDWKLESDSLVRKKLKNLELSLKSFPEIKSISFSADNSIPYSRSMWSTYFDLPNGGKTTAILNSMDDNFANVMDLNMIEGRWFNETDLNLNQTPLILNKKLAELYFSNEPAAGKIIVRGEKENKKEYKVIGVVDKYKYGGEFTKDEPTMVLRIDLDNPKNKMRDFKNLMIKLKAGTGLDFEEKLVKYIISSTGGWEVNAEYVEEKREAVIKDNVLQILIPSSLAFFLILNVGFGLMGVLWYSINRRKSEIGLRRAIGASGRKIYEQIIIEALLLGSFAITVGVVFAIQVPILQIFDAEFIIYIISIATSAVFLYCLVTVCSFYPGLLASKIQPVDALHNE